MSIFEIGMLFCFGISWPLTIYKSITSKTAKGKSLGYLLFVQAGYLSGIIHKIVYDRDIVIILYLVNLIMVSIDVTLTLINKQKDKATEKQQDVTKFI